MTPKISFGGSRDFRSQGAPQQIEVLPERKIITFRDFRRGFTPSEQRQMVDSAASPNTYDWMVRLDNRIQRAPGTAVLESYGQTIQIEDDPATQYTYEYGSFIRNPQRLALHPTLNNEVELVLFSPPEIGFRNQTYTLWHNLNMADRDEFASTAFGGNFIFTDGLRVWWRETSGSEIEILEGAPVARDYASFAARVFAANCIIDGRLEPLGVSWSAANSDFRDWDGIGSGFELLINDVSSGDQILNFIPMNLGLTAVIMRQSIWVGRFTGQVDRPVNFDVQVTGSGAINKRVAKLSRFGIPYLSDFGVYLFDGNISTLISKDINAELLPIDYDNLNLYHATYDPNLKRYILFTPTDCWIYEFEHNRWLRRTFSCLDSLMFPTQIDPVRWFELVGDWTAQAEYIWLDYRGQNLGELNLYMLGDRANTMNDELVRTLEEEDQSSRTYFGTFYRPYWETKLTDEQNASMLITSTEQQIEYEGEGGLRIYLPDEDNQYDSVLDVAFQSRDYPSLAVLNAEKVGKGTGIGIELSPEGFETPTIPLPSCNLPAASDFPEFE